MAKKIKSKGSRMSSKLANEKPYVVPRNMREEEQMEKLVNEGKAKRKKIEFNAYYIN